jgi:hypothetical protein
MTSAHSIGYGPESPGMRQARSSRRPDWTLCRSLKEFPIPDNTVLQRWTEQGCVRPCDYLVNHQLDVCVQAKDIAEVDAVFRKSTARLLGKICRALVCGAVVLVWPTPLFGSVMMVSAIVAAILSFRTARPNRTYLLYTTGIHSAACRPADNRAVTTGTP